MDTNFLPRAVRKYSKVIIKKGIGSWVYNINNRKYMDFTSGIGVLSLGHNNKRVNNAIKKQLKYYNHAQQMCLSDPIASQLAEKISNITPTDLNVCFFTPSGSEAVDTSIRMARYFTKKKRILSIKGGFHGRTLGVMALTQNAIPQRSSIEPCVDLCGCTDDIIKYIEVNMGVNIAAVIIEVIQGEGGIYKQDKQFIINLKQVCELFNIIFIVDEIQSGLCRTGKMFAFQHFDIIPDIILIAKGIANGVPLGAVISRKDIFNECPVGGLGGTYGGNALSMSAAKEVIDIMVEQSLDIESQNKGNFINNYLKELQKENTHIKDVRVYGLMVGVEFDFNVRSIIEKCESEGLLILPTNNSKTLRFLPALNISYNELKYGLDIFKKNINISSISDVILDSDYISSL